MEDVDCWCGTTLYPSRVNRSIVLTDGWVARSCRVELESFNSIHLHKKILVGDINSHGQPWIPGIKVAIVILLLSSINPSNLSRWSYCVVQRLNQEQRKFLKVAQI